MTFRRSTFFLFAVLCLALLSSRAYTATPEPPANPREYVTDLAGVMDDTSKARLNALLQELDQKTTAQVLVLTVQSLDGQDIEGFSINMAERWKLGQKGKDNGALLVVAVQDRKYRFEIGYGLESVLPDSMVGTIGREYLVPYFRKGDYGTGIYSAMVAVAGAIASNADVELSGMPAISRPPAEQTGGPGMFNLVLFGLFGVVALILFVTHPRQCFLILLMSQMGGGRGGWSGGGGGFGSGGGGFGGGGGGGFGGGGASGGW